MRTLTLRGLWAHKLRYALTGLAVVLGVAFMAGTMVLTQTMEQTFDKVFDAANEGTDVIVRRDAVIEGELATARDRVDAGVVAQVASVEGVASARGSVQGVTQLVEANGATSTTDGLGVTVGANWIDDARLNAFSLASGRAPHAASEAVLDRNTVEDQGWELGDSIRVLTATGPAELTVVGTATYGALDGVPGSSLVATDDETAQRLFAQPGRYDSVLVSGDNGVTPAELAGRVTATVAGRDSGLEALTGTEDTAARQADLKDDMAFFNQFLMAFAYVALFVGVFIIYNTFSIVVAQRMRDLAMLRALGARRSQVLVSVVLESVVVGLVSAVVGLVAGIGLSFGLRALLASGGIDVPSGSLVVSMGTVTTALVLGVAVSVLSAVVPAVRASRVRPIAALRDVAVDRSAASVARIASGLVLTAAGVVSFVIGLSASGDSALVPVGLGAVTVVLGVFTLAPVLVPPAMRVLGAPTQLFGITGKYARENARRTPKRTAATASALMVGVALVGFITILAASTKESIGAAVDSSFRADYVVESGSFTQGFATTIENDLRAVPGIGLLSPVRSAPADVAGSTADVMAVDTGTIDDLYDLEVTAGAMNAVQGAATAVAAKTAQDGGLAIGDEVPFRFADGQTVTLAVKAIFDSNTIGGEASWIVGLDTFGQHVSDQYDRRVFVGIQPGTAAADSRAAMEAALAKWPNAEIQDQGQFNERIAGQIDQLLNLIYGLLALAVIIAVIGIANTLALSVYERTRELGLLRAIGMHRRQLRRAIRWESFLIAVMGAILGAVLAVGAAAGVVAALDGEGVTRLSLPDGQMAVILGMAGVAGILAAAAPARRAAKMNVLVAIASD